ncbi:hypothetical protein [Pedobacter sp. Leaf170]|uniref:hypothetical protein n=1 Tax=Pedobacter sp. Leaf170 TaxID=2876558 RepID=UPI001E37538A|nr:hypothetical protein [Pedobacter sp. Leaf170]
MPKLIVPVFGQSEIIKQFESDLRDAVKDPEPAETRERILSVLDDSPIGINISLFQFDGRKDQFIQINSNHLKPKTICDNTLVEYERENTSIILERKSAIHLRDFLTTLIDNTSE